MHAQVDQYLHQCFIVGVYEPYVGVCRRLAELSPCAGENQKYFAQRLAGATGITAERPKKTSVVASIDAEP